MHIGNIIFPSRDARCHQTARDVKIERQDRHVGDQDRFRIAHQFLALASVRFGDCLCQNTVIDRIVIARIIAAAIGLLVNQQEVFRCRQVGNPARPG